MEKDSGRLGSIAETEALFPNTYSNQGNILFIRRKEMIREIPFYIDKLLFGKEVLTNL